MGKKKRKLIAVKPPPDPGRIKPQDEKPSHFEIAAYLPHLLRFQTGNLAKLRTALALVKANGLGRYSDPDRFRNWLVKEKILQKRGERLFRRKFDYEKTAILRHVLGLKGTVKVKEPVEKEFEPETLADLEEWRAKTRQMFGK